MATEKPQSDEVRLELVPGVRLVVSDDPAVSGGPPTYELVHLQLGIRQSLTEAEYRAFDRLKGGAPVREVVAEIEGAHRLSERLIGAGLLRPRGESVGFLPDDRPRLAAGVRVGRSEKKGLFSITAPDGRVFEVHDLEAMIAKTLDGSHTILDIVEAARLKGIPATLPTMVSFLKQLGAMNCLERALGPLTDEELSLRETDEPPGSLPAEPPPGPEPAPAAPAEPAAPAPAASASNRTLEALRSLSFDKGGDGEGPRAAEGSGRWRWLALAAALAVGGLAFGLLLGRGTTPAGGARGEQGPPALAIRTVSAPGGDAARVIAAGYVAAREPITLGVTTGGRVAAVMAENGKVVGKDAVLVQLDDSQLRAEIQLARAKAKDAARLLRRTRTLVENQAATRTELDRAIGAMEIAEAEVAVKQAQLEQARVRSPIANATILDVLVRPGEVLAPLGGVGAQVVKLADLSKLVAEVDVNEVDVFKLAVGHSAEVSPDADPRRTYQGVVRELGQVADKARGTVLVKVDLLVPDRSLRPGNSVKVQFRGDSVQRVLIPSSALGEGGVVWVVGSDGTVQPRRISSRLAGPERVEVISGLAPSERIVVEGISTLRAGQKVE